MPFRIDPDDPERIYRAFPYGPSLDVFVLDVRSYRGAEHAEPPGPAGEETAFLGPEQLAVAQARGSCSSRATWKVIASDMPLGLVVRDGPTCPRALRGVGQRRPGPPLGRELEIADLLALHQDDRASATWSG